MPTALKIALGVGCGILLAGGLLVFGCTAMLGYGASKVEEEKASKIAAITVRVDSFAEERDWFQVRGVVTNTGTRPVTYVKVGVDFVSGDGNVVDTDWTYAVDSQPLAPGASKRFEVQQKATPGVTRVTAAVID